MTMDVDSELSNGALMRLLTSEDNDEMLWTAGHVLQILSLKRIPHPREGQGSDRYRLIVSDGTNYTQAMLATQLNHLVEENQLQKNDVVRVEKLTCNNVQTKRLLILLNVTVVRRGSEKIGNPQNMDLPGQAATVEGSGTTPALAASTTNTPAPQPTVGYQKANKATAPSGAVVFPIEGLSPYSNKWTIRARVTQKSPIKEYVTAKGEGRLFNVTLMDQSGEIRATGFNQSVDKLYDKLQEGKVYYISKARVNLAKKKFSPLNNEYELGLEQATEIEECTDPTNLPQLKFSFVELAALNSVEANATCDVIGVVKEATDVMEIQSKRGALNKRELTLVDRSATSVRLTLWGTQAEQYQESGQPVIAFKGARVGDFNGRSLSMIGSTTMTINPDIPEAHMLRGWFDADGSNQEFKSYSSASTGGSGAVFRRDELRTLENVKESQMGTGDKADFFSCRATILVVKTENLTYPACPTPQCNKKVTEVSEGWKCEKCDRSFERPQHRYIMSMSVSDYTGQAWLQGFNDIGETVFGMPADQLIEVKEADEAKFNAIVQRSLCCTYNFTCRAKQDTYNEQTRVRYGIQKLIPLDYKAEAYVLRDLLNSAWAK